MMLEKIKEYLRSVPYGQQPEKTAKDITEICEKEYKLIWKGGELFNRRLMVDTKVIELEKENEQLKSKISKLEKNEEIYHKRLKDIKYLSRQEVEKIMEEFRKRIVGVEETFNDSDSRAVNYDFTNQTLIRNYTTAILSLATNRDKIIEVLLDQLYRFEGVMGKYNCGTNCLFQAAFHRLIRIEIDKLKNEIGKDK